MDQTVIGSDGVGGGVRRVIVLHDWMSDTSTWKGARTYLDLEQFSWRFADLRGYGRSRGRSGDFTIQEAASDVVALADQLKWPRFAIVGHSMSTLVAIHLAQSAPERVERLVLITPAPPRGFGAQDAWLEEAQAIARDDLKRAQMVNERLAGRLSMGWAKYKGEQFVATSDALAAAAYIAMFARDGLPLPAAPINVPVLAITGEQDVPPMRRDAVQQNLAPLCARLEIVALAESGHYPMQEMPPLTVTLVERFLALD
ncbi:MAG: hypothetical protein JWN04_1239 [Myxococcaceae bacterium]|nr:hypothetical protein [Myxococcaceae bacterium]